MGKTQKNYNISNLVKALLKKELITKKQLLDAKSKQLVSKRSLQELLVEMDYIEENELIKISSKVFDIPVFNPNKEKIDSAATKLISDKVARRYSIFPVRKDTNALILAMVDPTNIIALDDIAIMANMEIKPVLSTKANIIKCITKYYQLDDSLYDILKNMKIAKDNIAKIDKVGQDIFDLKAKDDNYKSSVAVRLVNFMLNDAIKSRASDVHIEAQENFVIVRYRIDGKLKNMIRVPIALHSALITRLKILTKLNISEKRKPQDGRVRILIENRKIDLRVSIMPTFYGEKVAIRLLDPKEAMVELDKLGFQKEELDTFIRAIRKNQGMILVTGPTSSGKTSTLYAALNFIRSETKNIVTIEDPIEYLIEGINQMQINPAKDITFATGLRNILRQDPNVILVGEIRDKKAADIAFRASLTGHLVFSTLHTRNAASSITRLINMGMEPYAISSSLILIVSQRLVRLICPYCREEYTPDEKLLDKFDSYVDKFEIKKFFRGKGCEHCNFTGYYGRTAILEILKVNEKIKNLVANGASEDIILKEAKKNGLRPLAESGIEKVSKGLTTLEEATACIDMSDEQDSRSRSGAKGSGTSYKTCSYGSNIFYREDVSEIDHQQLN
jgi:type IV pilus assembly protein PilB